MRFATDMTDDQFIDSLIELEDAFKGYGVSDAEGPLSATSQKLVDAVKSFSEYDQRLIDAGVRPSAFGGARQLDTGVLQQGVPGPYMKDKAGKQTRVFMNTEVNPITGGRELVPALDPDDGSPLSYVFGKSVPRGINDPRADELSAQMIMKLRGLPTTTRPDGGRGLSDLVSTFPDGRKVNVDVMMGPAFRPNGLPVTTKLIPAYTKIEPRVSYRGELTEAVQDLVKAEQATGKTLVQAVDALAARGVLGDSHEAKRVGKILRNDPQRVDAPDEVYHSLIMPEFNNEIMQSRVADTVTVAPTAIKATDLSKVRRILESGALDQTAIYAENFGANRNGPQRAQIKVRVPVDGEVIQDLTQLHPMTQQMLHRDSMQYTRKPRRR